MVNGKQVIFLAALSVGSYMLYKKFAEPSNDLPPTVIATVKSPSEVLYDLKHPTRVDVMGMPPQKNTAAEDAEVERMRQVAIKNPIKLDPTDPFFNGGVNWMAMPQWQDRPIFF